MIRVCHMTSTHGNHDQRILLKECFSLADAGYEVFQVAQGEDGVEHGVTLVGTGERKTGAFYRLVLRPRHVYKLAKKLDADIYHFHDMELLPYAKKLKRAGKKVIFDCHEDFASRFADSDRLPLPKSMMRLLARAYSNYEKSVVSRIDAIISVTPHICARLSQTNPETVMVTNYPIIDEDSPWRKIEFRDADSKYICFAGQVSCNQYGLDTAVEAIQSFPDLRFVIAGPVRREADLEKIEELDENHKTEYAGVLPFSELPNLIGHSIAALATVAYTADTCDHLGTLGSNKLFEAMLCGVPVIFTNFDLWREINDRYHFGIAVEKGNVEELKKAISTILDDPERAKEMGTRGRKAVLEEFNWKSQETRLLDVYLHVQEGH